MDDFEYLPAPSVDDTPLTHYLRPLYICIFEGDTSPNRKGVIRFFGEIFHGKYTWSDFAKAYNARFPGYKPVTGKYLNDKFHSLQYSSTKKLTEHEKQFILQWVAKNGRQWTAIAKLLNKRPNVIKGFYYRSSKK